MALNPPRQYCLGYAGWRGECYGVVPAQDVSPTCVAESYAQSSSLTIWDTDGKFDSHFQHALPIRIWEFTEAREHEIHFDPSKSGSPLRKPLDVTRQRPPGRAPRIALQNAIRTVTTGF